MIKTIFRLFTISQLVAWITAPISILMISPGNIMEFWATLALGNTISFLCYLVMIRTVKIEDVK
jgi:hypothetical protein